MIDEADKEYKKMSEQIAETQCAMKVFIALMLVYHYIY